MLAPPSQRVGAVLSMRLAPWSGVVAATKLNLAAGTTQPACGCSTQHGASSDRGAVLWPPLKAWLVAGTPVVLPARTLRQAGARPVVLRSCIVICRALEERKSQVKKKGVVGGERGGIGKLRRGRPDQTRPDLLAKACSASLVSLALSSPSLSVSLQPSPACSLLQSVVSSSREAKEPV